MVVVYVEKYQGILMLKSSFWQVILLYTYSNGGMSQTGSGNW